MRRFAIRTRIVLWYVISAVLLCVLFAAILYASVNRSLYNAIYRTLEVSAFVVGDEVDIDQGFLEFEQDLVVDDNVIYSVYGFDGTLLCNHKESWLDKLEGYSEAPYSITVDDEQWWVLDGRAIDDGVHIADLRVAVKNGLVGDTTQSLYRMFLILIPAIAALSIFAGIFIARNAMRPVENITNTALEIRDGDLNRRIHYEGKPDEIGRLASAFDAMLDELQQAFDREKRFTSDASHELRTPLAVIIAHAEAVLDDAEALPPEDLEAVQTIYDEARDMQKMLSQLMLFARGREQQDAMEVVSLDIADMLRDIAESIAPLAGAKSIELDVRAEEGQHVRGDLMLLTRMFLNIVENAVKYGRAGGSIQLSAHTEGEQVVVGIEDDGMGIAPGDIPHVFDRFYRSDQARGRKSGVGLGLSLAAWIAQVHGGDISVQSEVGKGTRFTIRLPGEK